MKFYLIVFVAIGVVIFSAYYIGGRVAVAQCVASRSKDVAQQQTKVIEIQRIVNDQVFNTATDDMRRVLREKYSIAE